MKRSLDDFAAECKQILTTEPGPDGRQKVVNLLQEVLQDSEFVDAYVGEGIAERQVLYEDPDLGFAVLAHSYEGARNSSPHDHGPTWAIYGQAAGTTEMTEWDVVEPGSREKTGLAKARRSTTSSPAWPCSTTRARCTRRAAKTPLA